MAYAKIKVQLSQRNDWLVSNKRINRIEGVALKKLLFQQFLECFVIEVVGIVGNKFLWRHAEIVVEVVGEIAVGGEAYLVGNLGNVRLVVDEEVGSVLEADAADESVWRDAEVLLELAVEVDSADAYVVAQLLHAVFVVVDVRHDGLVDALEEFLFGTVHRDCAVVVADFCASHLVADGFTHTKHLVEGTAQQLQVEWFWQEMIYLIMAITL